MTTETNGNNFDSSNLSAAKSEVAVVVDSKLGWFFVPWSLVEDDDEEEDE